jgi:hypothetical protein
MQPAVHILRCELYGLPPILSTAWGGAGFVSESMNRGGHLVYRMTTSRQKATYYDGSGLPRRHLTTVYLRRECLLVEPPSRPRVRNVVSRETLGGMHPVQVKPGVGSRKSRSRLTLASCLSRS